MKLQKRILPLLLILALAVALAACGQSAQTQPTQEPAQPSDTAAPAPAASGSDLPVTEPPATESDLSYEPLPASHSDLNPWVDAELPVRVMVMNGPTGFGMAKLICDAEDGQAALNYSFSVESDASNVTAALISGSTDIAVLPTNAASVVWNKTEGGVQVAAEVVRGNLYLLQNTEKEAVASFEDLRGKTIYAPAQNPTFITALLLKQNGLTPGEDVEIDNSYAQPADLRTALAAGEVDLAVLPEPMVTIAMSASESLAVALDLREAWTDATGSDSLVMGCVVVRTEFAEEHPVELAEFLRNYSASVSFVGEPANAETAGELIARAGIFAQAAVAQKALPRCSLCFVTGEQMREELNTYLGLLFTLNPASIGGDMPDDSFFYLP